MSRRWTAKCWMGSSSGYVDIEVNASSINGAKEQLERVYGAEQIGIALLTLVEQATVRCGVFGLDHFDLDGRGLNGALPNTSCGCTDREVTGLSGL